MRKVEMRYRVCALIALFVLSLFSYSCTYFPKTQVLKTPANNEISNDTEVQAQQNVSHNTGISYADQQYLGENNHTILQEELDDNEEESLSDVNSSKKIGPEKNEAGNNQNKNNTQEAVDDALALLNQSQSLWERGELDNALNLLDEAYSLVIGFDGEPDLAWQKDDLRLLIAKRIIEIYTSRSNVAAGYQCEIPLDINKEVQNEIKRFQNEERKFFLSSYRRAGRYIPTIVSLIKEAGLPEELSWLPLVESGFKVKALSRARALGLWQFIPSTGYKFGLKRDLWIDERMDVEKSTLAAISYLKELHSIFGDWLTVLAAYNCGEGRVLRVISRQHMNYLDNFWDLYGQLPMETARYVPRFIATLNIIRDPEKYGFDLKEEERDEPVPSETVFTSKSIKLKELAGQVDISEDILSSLNPELRYKMTPASEYSLKIPSGTGRKILAAVEKLPSASKPGGAEFVRHRIRRGESLSEIARKYGTSVFAIQRANYLSNKNTIRAGKWLKIPVRAYASDSRKTPETYKRAANAVVKNYRVMKGDSLWAIAKRFDTTVSHIRTLNNLANNNLSIGQELKVSGTVTGKESIANLSTYIVERGDNLFLISRKCKMDLNTLLSLNRLSKDDVIFPGQRLLIRN